MASYVDRYSDIESDTEEDELTIQFNSASKHLQKLVSTSKIDDSLLLSLYGLYKTATVGKCDVSRPSWYELKAKQKWDAWSQVDDLPKEEAKDKYVTLIKKIDPSWEPYTCTSDVNTESWVNVSSMVNTEEELNESDKTIFDMVKEGNVEKFKELLENNTIDINSLDENGLGLIHWVCDRGNDALLEIILENNGNVNLQAEDGQTGLHYAASCGHVKCVETLLKYGVDRNLLDEDGMTASEVASDSIIANIITNFNN
ncbi:acyl-CoA-binding domain-containing protein 6-like [Chrysoperla carnea]|uniref:acyl-CoA-binding domain-containing protein 6-like n=1 Tax=Chrysoperla carnea TaxID=189513 RepID=UPI001D05FC47|nr:acyl-CoA-binding domain-containing protein 6-like [Chrysoperla carnea]